MLYDDKFVITAPVRILWDGITRPEKLDDGGLKYSLKVAMLSTAVEKGELEMIATKALQADTTFNGQLPPGGIWPLRDVQAGEFSNMLPGHICFNCSTYSVPEVYDPSGAKMDAIQYAPIFYPGSTVSLIVCAKSFNNISKGIKFELHGIRVIDATSPKIPVGSNIDAAAAFFGGAGSMPQPGAPGAIPAMAPAVASVPPQMAAPAVPAAVPVPGPSMTPAPAPAPDFLMVNGAQFTVQQLTDAGWTPEQIAAAR